MRARSTPHTNQKRVPLWIVLLMVPVLMGFGALGVLIYWDAHKEEIIRTKIESAIKEKSNGMYNIRYDSTHMNELEGNLSFYNLHLAYDSAKVQAAERKGIAPPLLFTIDIPEISVTGVKTSRAMANNEIIGKKLVIKNPVINLYTTPGKESDRNLPTGEDYKEILGGLKLVEVDTILLSSASITRRNRYTGLKIAEGKNIDITLFQVKIDSAAFEDKTRMMFSKDVNINIGTVTWASDDKMYNFNIGNISLTSSNNSMNVGNVTVKPSLGEDAFVKSFSYQEDRHDISMRGIRMSGVDIKKLKDEGALQAETIVIPSASFKIYRDLTMPRDKKNRVGHYPHQVLDDIGMPFSVKKIIFNDTYLEYKQKSDITREIGKVMFTDLNAVLANFTNDKKSTGQEMTAAINCRLLGQASFTTNWKFILFDQNGRFSVTGKLGSLNGLALNPLAEPFGPAHIREGQINGLDISLQGTNHTMNGTVKLLYENLKLDVLEKENDDGVLKTDRKTLTSFLANIVIKNSNPKNNEAPRVANVSMTRDSNRSMLWLCWKTIFKGIQETVGVKQTQGQP